MVLEILITVVNQPCERSAFYTMADSKTFPVLFTPVTDQDDGNNKVDIRDIPKYYTVKHVCYEP
jgi:hypothetical protein